MGCVEENYFKYSVDHDSQLWSLASKSGSVRQEVSYECKSAHPPLSFTGWDETEFDDLDIEQKQPCNVSCIHSRNSCYLTFFLFQSGNNIGVNEYSLSSRVPTRLPIIDVKAKKSSGSVSVTIKDVCFY